MKKVNTVGFVASCAVAFLFANTSFAVKGAPVSSSTRALGSCQEEDGNNLLQKPRHSLVVKRADDGVLEISHFFGDTAGPDTYLLSNGLPQPSAPSHMDRTPTWVDTFRVKTGDKDKDEGMQNGGGSLFPGSAGHLLGNDGECSASLANEKDSRTIVMTKDKVFVPLDNMGVTGDDEPKKSHYSILLTEAGKSVHYSCSLAEESIPDSMKCTNKAKSKKKTPSSVFQESQKKSDSLNPIPSEKFDGDLTGAGKGQ